MATLYVVHAFNTKDGRPSLEHMRRCASLQFATDAAHDLAGRYDGVIAYSRAQGSSPLTPGPRRIHFRGGLVPAAEPTDVTEIVSTPAGMHMAETYDT